MNHIPFTWSAPVNQDAFEWAEAIGPLPEEKPQKVLTSWHDRQKTYEPLIEETGMFLNFADLRLEGYEKIKVETKILDFANHFGQLGVACDSFRLVRPGGGSSADRPGPFEALFHWLFAIDIMSSLTHLWMCVQSQRVRSLKNRITWQKKDVLLLGHPALEGYQELSDDGAIRKLGIEEEDYIGAATYFLHKKLNDILSDLGPPRLWWDQESRNSLMTFSIKNLWTAMCFQFARAVAENRHYQSCQFCQKWFELSPSVNRADRIYCSDACRQRFHRLQRSSAKSMHERGKSIEEIAGKLRVNVQQVKNWLKQKEES